MCGRRPPGSETTCVYGFRRRGRGGTGVPAQWLLPRRTALFRCLPVGLHDPDQRLGRSLAARPRTASPTAGSSRRDTASIALARGAHDTSGNRKGFAKSFSLRVGTTWASICREDPAMTASSTSPIPLEAAISSTARLTGGVPPAHRSPVRNAGQSIRREPAPRPPRGGHHTVPADSVQRNAGRNSNSSQRSGHGHVTGISRPFLPSGVWLGPRARCTIQVRRIADGPLARAWLDGPSLPPIVAEIGRSVIPPIKPGAGSEKVRHPRESGEKAGMTG